MNQIDLTRFKKKKKRKKNEKNSTSSIQKRFDLYRIYNKYSIEFSATHSISSQKISKNKIFFKTYDLKKSQMYSKNNYRNMTFNNKKK